MAKIFKRKIKFSWKKILSTVGLVAILIGAVAGIRSCTSDETKTIKSTAFSVGGIDENGNYVETKTSIYTSDLFECQGLSIEPDFEATGTYKVFYYDSNKNFIGATDELNAVDGVYTKGDTFVFAQYARIMITPDAPVDEDGNIEEDFKIRFYKVMSYAGDYTIKVNKNQETETFSDNIYVASESMEGKYYGASLTDIVEGVAYSSSEIIDIKDNSKIRLVINNYDCASAVSQLCFADASGNFVKTYNLFTDEVELYNNTAYFACDIPENAVHLVINGLVNSTYCLYVK